MLLKVSGALDILPSQSCQWTGVPRSHLLLWVAQSWTALPEVSTWQWENLYKDKTTYSIVDFNFLLTSRLPLFPVN